MQRASLPSLTHAVRRRILDREGICWRVMRATKFARLAVQTPFSLDRVLRLSDSGRFSQGDARCAIPPASDGSHALDAPDIRCSYSL